MKTSDTVRSIRKIDKRPPPAALGDLPPRYCTAIRECLCAILLQAVLDYRTLVKAGYILAGRRVPGKIVDKQHPLPTGMDIDDFLSVLDLFGTEELDRFCAHFPVEVNPDGIRRALRLPPPSKGNTP